MSLILALDVVVDVVCPWCFVGKRRLDAAMALVPEMGFRAAWKPFQLDPTLPPAGKDRARYMLDKFGDQRRIDEAHARLEQLGEPLGITFAFGRIARTPNTFDAHCLIRRAAAGGKADALVEAMFSAFFEQGRDLTDRAVLTDLALSSGLADEEISAVLDGRSEDQAVAADLAFAGRAGISGVPFTIVDGKWGISGAQEPAVLADAFRRVAADRA